MLAYNSQPEIKEQLISRLEAHREADRLIQGYTGRAGKGCTVWCALNDDDLRHGYTHEVFPEVLGLPIWLARLIDNIYEGLQTQQANIFAVDVFEAIPVGKDLNTTHTNLANEMEDFITESLKSLTLEPEANELRLTALEPEPNLDELIYDLDKITPDYKQTDDITYNSIKKLECLLWAKRGWPNLHVCVTHLSTIDSSYKPAAKQLIHHLHA